MHTVFHNPSTRKLLTLFFGLAAAASYAQEAAPIFRKEDPAVTQPAPAATELAPIRPRIIAPAPETSLPASEPASIFRAPEPPSGAENAPLMPVDDPPPAASAPATPASNPLQPGIFRNAEPGTVPATLPPSTPPDGAPSAMPPAAQAPVPAAPEEPEVIITEAPKPDAKKVSGPGFSPGLHTARGARILTLSVPAPRGQIVDRNGIPFAQNMVVYFPALSFPQMDAAPPAEKIQFARKRLDVINAALEKSYSIDDAQILNHYQNRRWLPLVVSRTPLSDLEKTKFEAIGLDGITLHPTYQRTYPQREVAAHVIGYVGKRGPWATGEIPDGEALWPTAEGVRGIEKEFNDYLTGSPGTIQIIFDDKGNRVEETTVANPVPGGNVILSIDMEMQRLTEQLLRDRVKRGAFVIMDVQNGDVLAMASQPTYDPNEFVPIISTERLSELQSDPSNPLFGRAFQATYPPASTFKSVSAIGMLKSGTVTEWTEYPCPKAFNIGDRVAHNWAKEDEGSMNIMGALTRSCNTWFYQGAMFTPPAYISRAGETFGFGRPTGIQLREEEVGVMPTNEWFRKQFGYPIGKGDLANIVIGQGTVHATPVQVARAMGALGNRKSLLDARLVLQIQDYANNIITSFDVSPHPLDISQHDLAVVHQGLYDVVHHERGTGKSAGHPRMSVSGKTGTGQWIPAKKQNIAWFVGFAPSKFPVYSFAVVYEGDPGEDEVGGGKKAAPIVGEFFRKYLTEEQLVALEKRAELIAAEDAQMIASVQLGTGSIIRGGAIDNAFDVALPPPDSRFGARRLDRGAGSGGFFRLFRKR